ncbi:MAG: hypothetical protein IT380_18090 [Myxococcales bacterium]|nr:hypothetical protein [Myxococcales bacterium]
MRRLAPIALAVVLGCPEEPPPPPPAPAPRPVARLAELEGPVSLERDGGAAAAKKEPLFQGDVVATGAGARAVLADERGRQLELGEDTRFKVGASLAALEVETGEIAFLSDDDGGTAWGGASLSTPFGKATLAAGTAARLRVRDGGLAAEVSIGEIELEEVDGGARTAKAGQRLQVGVGLVELEEPAQPPPPQQILFKVEAGKPQVKPKGSARFVPTTKDTPLEAGAAYKVPAGARARLEGDALVLLVQPGGAGQVESVENLGGLSALSLKGAAGASTLRLTGKQKAKLELDDVTLSGSQETTAAVTPQGKRRRIEVRVGELEVRHAGQTKVLKAGDALVVGGGAIEEPQPLKVALTLPMGKRVQVYAAKLGHVGLGLPDEPRRVQVAHDSNFEALLVEGVAAKQVVVPAPAKGELYWRTLDDKGQPQTQGRARFSADTASLKEGTAKTDTVHETGLKATIYFQRQVPTLTFTFAPSPGATGYRLRVYQAGDLKAAVVEKKVPEPKATVESGQLGEGSYLWSASPLDAAGNESGGGRMNKLDVVYDNSTTTLRIASPRNGDKRSGSLRASGVAPLDSSLTINGKAVALDAQGRFSTPVPDTDTVVFRLKADGADSFWVRRLRR